MPMAAPRSLGSHISATVPAPTDWKDDAALALRNRIARSMPMFLETAARTLHSTKRTKETMYTVRRPECSERADHQRGQNAMPILEMERVRSARVRLVWRSAAVSCSEAMWCIR